MPRSAAGARAVIDAMAGAVVRLNAEAVRIARELSAMVAARLTRVNDTKPEQRRMR
jgi:hypothetical protein